jgi:hypothetical protein
MNSTYGIIDYSVNSLCAYISHQTNTPFNQVKQKPQITYLSNYLDNFIDPASKNSQKIKDIVIVYENDYVDKHYLEDYSAYYASCFANYKKTCSRLHFFKDITDSDNSKEDKPYIEFEKLSNGKCSDYSQDNYLGFIILRPIPYTFFANICLRAYESNEDRKLLTKENTASLFGQTFKVESIPFQEQDRAVSACATASLWTFYQSCSINCHHSVPPPNQITKSAYPEKHGYTREFPSAGLSTKMICRSLRHYGFTPEKYQFDTKKSDDKEDKPDEVKKKNISLLKEYLYTYSSSNIPLILGITVKDLKGKKTIGEHAVTVVGHKINTTLVNETGNMMFSKYLEKLYTHDDRYGAFMRMEIASDTLNVSLDTELSDVSENALFEDVGYEIDSIIIGIYHKIRVPYVRIKTIVNTLSAGLLIIFNPKKSSQSEIEWDIKLELNNSIKKDIKNSDIENKTKYLAMSFPKYIWTATILVSGKRVIKLLFDATDIEQGYIFLGAIPISDKSNIIFEFFFNEIKKYTTKYMNEYNSSDLSSRESLFGFYEYFKNETSMDDVLTGLYGYPKMPRYIKAPETDNDTIVKKDISANQNKLDIKMKYIWLIDEQGILRYDIEDVNNIGHPTLTNGKPARIGGELNYDDSKKRWMVNGSSGRFSKGYTPEDRQRYIANVIKHQFNIYLEEEFEQALLE